MNTEIKHVVVFKYKPAVTLSQKQEIIQRFLALKNTCKKDGKEYIVSIVAGDCSHSIEGLDQGFQHAFIVTFKNRQDFEYYIGRPFYSPFDQEHDEFKNYIQPFLEVNETGDITGAMVFDFEATVA
jgi:hypothetical protein